MKYIIVYTKLEDTVCQIFDTAEEAERNAEYLSDGGEKVQIYSTTLMKEI